MTQAVTEIRDLLAGRPGGVNRVIRRFGKPVVDYCSALIPDRSAPFERMVEDILVDIIAQARATARARSDDEVFEFAMESATRTVRARYRDVLEAPRREVAAALDMRAAATTRATAAERELLCLHFALGFSPETIARWAGEAQAHVESLIDSAARAMSGSSEGPEAKEMRRYIDGRMDDDASAKFEQAIIKDRIAQSRLDELRTQTQSIKALFNSPALDFSRISVNVRARNPHHALSLPPTAALWIQIVGIAAMLLMFHRVGAYVAPPLVYASEIAGRVQLPPEGRLRVGERVRTDSQAQVLMVLDGSNRVLLAGNSEVELARPRENARQAIRLARGEIWGRFTAGGHAFAISLPEQFEVIGDGGADFSLAVGPAVPGLLPDNLETEQLRVLASTFSAEADGLRCNTAWRTLAGFHAGSDEVPGLRAGDLISAWDDNAVRTPQELAAAATNLSPGGTMMLEVRRGNEQLSIALTRNEAAPIAVLRVFHGAVVVSTGSGRHSVNRGQWALLYSRGTPFIGLRGQEDFRTLRLSAAERFKDAVHWLDTEGFPLRAKNSTLPVERALRAIAEDLESRRGRELRRNARDEIMEFERLLQETFDAARARLIEERSIEHGEGPWALSDYELLAAEDEIMSHVVHWRRQSGTGIYPTLRVAANTLQRPIDRIRQQQVQRNEDIGRASAMLASLSDLKQALERQSAQLAQLQGSEFHDADGAARAALDQRLASLTATARAGTQAQSRLDFTRLKLNELDAKLDDERRRLPELQRNVNEARAALGQIVTQLEANIYTPRRLTDATAAVNNAELALGQADAQFAEKDAAASRAEQSLRVAERALRAAQHDQAARQQAQQAALAQARQAQVAEATAQGAATAADAEVERLAAELQRMEEDDPRRQALEQELKEAREAQAQARDALRQALAAAEAAKLALATADAEQASATERVASTTASLETARVGSEQAAVQAAEARATVEARQQELAKVLRTVEAQRAAQAERQRLDALRVDAAGALSSAEEALQRVQARIAGLEAEAEPRREEFQREMATVRQGEAAQRELEEVRRERGRYQAISDEIAIRERDRAELQKEHDALSGHHLVLGFQQLMAEEAELDVRQRALEYLRVRAFAEDEIFAHKQTAALERFREADRQAAAHAMDVLRRNCPPYSHDAYAVITQAEKPDELRKAVLRALWTFYYNAGLDEPDGAASENYYVLVQSRASPEAFGRLDARWRTYLGEALGRQGFERVSNLTQQDLTPLPEEAHE